MDGYKISPDQTAAVNDPDRVAVREQAHGAWFEKHDNILRRCVLFDKVEHLIAVHIKWTADVPIRLNVSVGVHAGSNQK